MNNSLNGKQNTIHDIKIIISIGTYNIILLYEKIICTMMLWLLWDLSDNKQGKKKPHIM